VPDVDGWKWKVSVLFIGLLGLAFIYFQDKGYRPFFIVMLVLIASFYMATQRQKITYRGVGTEDPDMYLIVDTSRVEIPIGYEVVDTFRKREDWKLMQIVKKK